MKYMQADDGVKLAAGLGADAALLKPFDENQLLHGINRAMTAERRRWPE
jgi:CheY-like chemotaxis protein